MKSFVKFGIIEMNLPGDATMTLTGWRRHYGKWSEVFVIRWWTGQKRRRPDDLAGRRVLGNADGEFALGLAT